MTTARTPDDSKVMRCRTCRWWADEGDQFEHLCKAPINDPRSEGTDLIIAQCVCGRGGLLATGPEFGCVHWEGRDGLDR